MAKTLIAKNTTYNFTEQQNTQEFYIKKADWLAKNKPTNIQVVVDDITDCLTLSCDILINTNDEYLKFGFLAFINNITCKDFDLYIN